MWGRSQPLSSPQRRSSAAVWRAKRSEAALVIGTPSRPAKNRSWLRWSRKQRTRVLALVPRGSQLTTSKRPPPNASNPSGSPANTPTPVSPGPPGFMNIVPIRCSGLLARWRISARRIVRPFGRSQSSGTRIRAHCRSSPGGSQTPQAIGAPTQFARAVGPARRRRPRRRPRARPDRHQPTLRRRGTLCEPRPRPRPWAVSSWGPLRVPGAAPRSNLSDRGPGVKTARIDRKPTKGNRICLRGQARPFPRIRRHWEGWNTAEFRRPTESFGSLRPALPVRGSEIR